MNIFITTTRIHEIFLAQQEAVTEISACTANHLIESWNLQPNNNISLTLIVVSRKGIIWHYSMYKLSCMSVLCKRALTYCHLDYTQCSKCSFLVVCSLEIFTSLCITCTVQNVIVSHRSKIFPSYFFNGCHVAQDKKNKVTIWGT